jgi:hypothetical protein
MDKKEEENILKCIKESLQNDFGNFPESMTYELLKICKIFPNFLKFYLSCFDMTITEALDAYLKLITKQKPKFCRKVFIKQKKENNILYYMLLGMLFNDAFELLDSASNIKVNIDYTDAVNQLLKSKYKNRFN